MTTEILTEVAMFQVGQLVRVTQVKMNGNPSRKMEPGTYRVTCSRYSSAWSGFVYDLEALVGGPEKDIPAVSQRYIRA